MALPGPLFDPPLDRIEAAGFDPVDAPGYHSFLFNEAPRPVATMKNGTLLAGIDLGSNSFRLEIGRFMDGHVERVETLKETVRQGSGLDESRNLTPDAMQRGLQCLSRFKERLKGFPAAHVRAVATQTLREARNRQVFLDSGGQALGFPIEVISGKEEARLIYEGVSHMLAQSGERRLVIDVGGRSTELILGAGYTCDAADSYRVGSVAWSMKYFAKGELSEAAFKHATLAASSFLEPALAVFQPQAWDIAYGASGTIGAVAEVLAQASFEPDVITQDGLQWLKRQLVRAQHVDQINLQGLKDDRRSVIAGGLSVLLAVFELFKIDTLIVAKGALRHGLLFDMVGRESGAGDMRSDAVLRLARRFQIDTQHAGSVAAVAGALLQDCGVESVDPARLARKLQWAAQLHEIGAAISPTDMHRHGAYILDHADVPGFAQSELQRLALLVLGHRGKLKKLEADFSDLGFLAQLACLRLAVIVNHARAGADGVGLGVSVGRHGLHLRLDPTWARAHPQTAYLIQEEQAAWQKIGVQCDIAKQDDQAALNSAF